MNKLRLTLNLLAVVGFMLVVTSLAQAQATRTWVSGVGDDVNPCSRTAPCKTFAGAISKTFINGEIDCLDEGGFGTINITKSITIEGTQGGGFGSILASGTNGVIINVAASANDPLATVRLRNLAITGTGASGTVGTRTGINGVRVLNALNVYIESCVITDFSNRGITDERSTTGNLYISDTTVRNCAQSGIVVIPTNSVTVKAMIDHTRSEGNGSSGFVADSNTNVTISNSVAAGNAGGGFVSEQTTGVTKLNLESCVSANNGQGITAGTGASDTVCSNCNIFNNGIGLNFAGGTIHSYGNNKVSGNAGGGTSNGPFTAGGPTQQ